MREPDERATLREVLPFRELRLLSSNAGFLLFSAQHAERSALVVRPALHADTARARDALKALAEGHRRIDHPRSARVERASFDGPVPYVSFAIDAVANGLEVAARLARSGRRLSYAAGDGFVLSFREAMQAAHRASGGPYFLGRVSLANAFFEAEGRWQIVGFGFNVVVLDERGRADPRIKSFYAPELLVDPSPTAMSDYVALLQLARSIVEHVDLPPALSRVLRGAPSGFTERVLVRWLRYTEQRILAELPGTRPSLETALRAARHIRALVGVGVDARGIERVAAALLESEATVEAVPGQWIVSSDGACVEHHDARIALRGPARTIFGALLDQALWNGDRALDVWKLFEAAWPEEPFHYERAMNRVHATISRMRKAGLAPLIERSAQGYRLSSRESVLRRARPEPL